MKAAYFDRYGPPGVLSVRDVPAPVAGPRDIVVRQVASNVSPADLAFRSGRPFIVRFFAGLLRPKQHVPGETIAGVVEAVGPQVTRFRPGDRVFGITESAEGALAELVAVPEDGGLVAMPDRLGFEEAGGLPYSFLTAMPFLRDEAQLQAGQSILIIGAAGSIGTVAVQLARHMGAHVTAVCSTRNVEMVRGLGAQDVIDRTVENYASARNRYDAIFDTVGKSSFAACRDALKPGGIYLTTVPSLAIVIHMLRGKRRDNTRAKLATTGLRPLADKRRDLELLRDMVARGELRGIVDRVFPLEHIADAHRYVEQATKAGDAIISVSEAPR